MNALKTNNLFEEFDYDPIRSNQKSDKIRAICDCNKVRTLFAVLIAFIASFISAIACMAVFIAMHNWTMFH